MVLILRNLALIFIGLTMFACSSTDMTGSWTNSDFKGPIKKVYVVGIAKSEMNRRIFEDAFSNQFFSKGVSSEASYRDITFSKDVNKEVLAKKMAERGCDSVVLTRLIGQRKETCDYHCVRSRVFTGSVLRRLWALQSPRPLRKLGELLRSPACFFLYANHNNRARYSDR